MFLRNGSETKVLTKYEGSNVCRDAPKNKNTCHFYNLNQLSAA